MSCEIDIRRIEVIDEQTADMYRHMTPGQRLKMGLRAGAVARRMIQAGIRHQHPSWTPEQVQAEIIRRLSHGAH